MVFVTVATGNEYTPSKTLGPLRAGATSILFTFESSVSHSSWCLKQSEINFCQVKTANPEQV